MTVIKGQVSDIRKLKEAMRMNIGTKVIHIYKNATTKRAFDEFKLLNEGDLVNVKAELLNTGILMAYQLT